MPGMWKPSWNGSGLTFRGGARRIVCADPPRAPPGAALPVGEWPEQGRGSALGRTGREDVGTPRIGRFSALESNAGTGLIVRNDRSRMSMCQTTPSPGLEAGKPRHLDQET